MMPKDVLRLFTKPSILNVTFDQGRLNMNQVLIVAIIFGSVVLIPAIIGGTILLSIRLLKGKTSRKDQADDSKIIQEIYQGLSRMEERVEALETILLDREKRGF
jgi:phage shock protein B